MPSSYAEKLKHPMWQRKRLEIMERAGFKCADCGGKEKTLHIHHKLYEKNREPWEYDNETMECLCEDCHLITTNIKKDLNKYTGKLLTEDLPQLLGYVKGLESRYYPGIRLIVNSYEEAVGVSDFWHPATPESIIDALDADRSISAQDLSDLSEAAKDIHK